MDYNQRQTLRTESGFPEIQFESVHVTKGDLAGVLINHYLDRGHIIRDRTESTVVLDGPYKESTFSRTRTRKTFNLVETRNRLRVVAQAQRLEFPLSGSSRIQDIVDLPPGGSVGQELQNDLDEIRSRLVDDETFQGLRGANESPAPENESSTASDK